MNRDYKLEILSKLLTSKDGLRFVDAKPEGIENDLYTYHLKQLIKLGLVRKFKDKYSLTKQGKQSTEEIDFIDSFSLRADRFKVASLCLVFDKESKKVLYQTRTRQPLYGNQEIIGGGVRKGETFTDTASRRLKEESGLTADFKWIGVIRKIRYVNTKELFNDIIYNICYTDTFNGELEAENSFGKNYWIDLDKAIKLEKSKTLVETYKFLQQNSILPPFFTAEEKYFNLGD